MIMKEPKAMEEIHKIREQLAEEWRLKSSEDLRKERERVRMRAAEMGLKFYKVTYGLPGDK